MLLTCALLAIAVGHKASNNNSGLILGGVIGLSESGATVFYWVLTAMISLAAVASFVFLFVARTSIQLIELTDVQMLAPVSLMHRQRLTVSYVSITDVRLVERNRYTTYLGVHFNGKVLSIPAFALPNMVAFEELHRELLARMSRSGTSGRSKSSVQKNWLEDKSMAFTREQISERDLREIDFTKVDSRYHKTASLPSTWVIDRERDAFLMHVTVANREEIPLIIDYALSWKGTIFHVYVADHETKKPNDRLELIRRIVRMDFPKGFDRRSAEADQALELAREALLANTLQRSGSSYVDKLDAVYIESAV